jgi:hypothetical protein
MALEAGLTVQPQHATFFEVSCPSREALFEASSKVIKINGSKGCDDQ